MRYARAFKPSHAAPDAYALNMDFLTVIDKEDVITKAHFVNWIARERDPGRAPRYCTASQENHSSRRILPSVASTDAVPKCAYS